MECREDDRDLLELLGVVEHAAARRCVDAERSFLAALGGDCSLPAAAYATLTPAGELSIEGRILSVDGRTVLRHVASGPEASVGEAVALHLLDTQGGRALLAQR